MSGKEERITVRVDADRKRRLDEDESVNVSGLLRSLLREWDLAGDTVEAGLKRRLKDEENELERLKTELTRVESDIDRKERKIDEIQNAIKERQASTPEEVVEFAQRIRDERFPQSGLEAGNPAVKNHADAAGLTPERFISEVENRL